MTRPAQVTTTRVGGVVVTYHPDAAFETRLAAMARQVATMIVVDNSAEDAVRLHLAAIAARLGCRLIVNTRNLGIAAALNGAFAEMERQGFMWAVAFDQDSTPEEGCVAALMRVAEVRPRAAVVGSNWWDEARPQEPTRHLVDGTGFRPWYRRVVATQDLDNVTFVITSGSLFRLAAWSELRGFRDNLFLDLVDTEYCLRAGAGGWGIWVAARARLRHRRGEKSPVRWGGRLWWPAHMTARRIHLLVRNRVWALRRYGWKRWPWALFETTHTAFMFFSAVCLEKCSWANIAAFLRGASDGLHGRLGAPDWARPCIPRTSVSADRNAPS